MEHDISELMAHITWMDEMHYQEFMARIELAERETCHISGGHNKNQHIRRIIEEANDDTVTFACLILQSHVHLALAILYELVPENERPPIPDYYIGRVPVIQACWQYWALQKGFLQIKYDPHAYWVEDKHGNKGNWC
jgi:hypothetical protein